MEPFFNYLYTPFLTWIVKKFTFILIEIKQVISYGSSVSELNIEYLIKCNEIKASHYNQNAASNEDVIPNQSTSDRIYRRPVLGLSRSL